AASSLPASGRGRWRPRASSTLACCPTSRGCARAIPTSSSPRSARRARSPRPSEGQRLLELDDPLHLGILGRLAVEVDDAQRAIMTLEEQVAALVADVFPPRFRDRRFSDSGRKLGLRGRDAE